MKRRKRGGERWRKKERRSSLRQHEKSKLCFFFPRFAHRLLAVLCIWTRSSQPLGSPASPPLFLLSLSLSLSLSAFPLFFPSLLRLVLRRAREARVLPVPIVSYMINDCVNLSPTTAAYASFRWLDRS